MTFDPERTMHDDALEHFRNCYADVMEKARSVMFLQRPDWDNVTTTEANGEVNDDHRTHD